MKSGLFSKRLIFHQIVFFLVIALVVLLSGTGISQEIFLDRMKKAGDLICYPSFKDPSVWYYLPDQPRLAMKDGKPQFSFLKYSRTSATGKAGINRAEGGGIVHFLVTYGASKDRVKAAEKQLKKDNPDARIHGPIVYRKGHFALITSFKEGEESLVKTVAIGKAPLIEGQKAAVSIALSREGAEVLWESFKTDTPDISLFFDMEFAGIREPYEATITGDWAKINKYRRLRAGMKYSWFGADVDMLFQELRQNGAINVTIKGEDKDMDKIMQSINAKLLSMMFEPVSVNKLAKAVEAKDPYSNLNQAMKAVKSNQRQRQSVRTRKPKPKPKPRPSVRGNRSSLDMNSPGFSQMLAAVLDIIVSDAHADGTGSSISQSSQAPTLPPVPGDDSSDVQDTSNSDIKTRKDPKPQVPDKSAAEAYNHARRLDEKARRSGYKQEDTEAAIDAYESYKAAYAPTGARAKEIEGRLRSLTRRLEHAALDKAMNTGDSTAVKGKEKPAGTTSSQKPSSLSKGSDSPAKPKGRTTPPRLGSKGKPQPSSTSRSRRSSIARRASQVGKRVADKKPGFSLVASYRMTKVEATGRLEVNLKKYRTEMQSNPMTENIGSLYSKYGSNSKIFRAVVIDDPVFKQREILVTLDGQDTSTFTKYLNFVTVKMKKRHQSGEYSTDEVVITPELFNKKGNSFSFTYGYKGDDDRNRWLDYQYQVIWSFHGGVEIRSPWKDETSPMLALMPPHRYRTLTIEGEAEKLENAQVRHAVVTINTIVNDQVLTTQSTIRNQGPLPSLHLDIPEDIDNKKADIRIKWFLKGGKNVESPARPIEGDLIYWDEIVKD